LIGQSEPIGVEAQIAVLVAHIGRRSDHAFERDDADPVVGGQ
jgi:hypothetical protein